MRIRIGTKPALLDAEEILRSVGEDLRYSGVRSWRRTGSTPRSAVGWLTLRGASIAIAFAAGLLPPSWSDAAPVPHGDRSVSYAVIQQSLPAAIAAIVGEVGLRADVSAKVTGEVRGRLPAGSVTDTLDRLGSIYGFDWFCEGTTIHVSSAGEARTAILPLGLVDAAALQQTLTAFGIADARWPVRYSQQGDVALVDGPPSYVAFVERTLDALGRRERSAQGTVTVFRGRA